MPSFEEILERLDDAQNNPEKYMEEAVEFTQMVGDLNNAVKVLETSKEKGENIFINFNGEKLYSFFDDLESCYLKVTGVSKEQFDKEMAEWDEQYRKERQQALDNIPSWIERGTKLIYPQRKREWVSKVDKHARGLYRGKDIERALQVMEALKNNESVDVAKKIFLEGNYSGAAYDVVLKLITTFSKRGPEFYQHIEGKMPEWVEEIVKHNEDILRGYKIGEKYIDATTETLVEIGSNLIYPQRKAEWKSYVEKKKAGLFGGLDVSTGLEVMEAIENGGISAGKEILDKGDPDMSHSAVIKCVTMFSKKGPEFYKEVRKDQPEWVQKIEKENNEYVKNAGGKDDK